MSAQGNKFLNLSEIPKKFHYSYTAQVNDPFNYTEINAKHQTRRLFNSKLLSDSTTFKVSTQYAVTW